MPQHKSAKKRVRQNERRRLHNRDQKSRMRTLIKRLQQTEGEAEARTLLNEVKGVLDRLAGKRVISKHRAAHLKGRLEREVNQG